MRTKLYLKPAVGRPTRNTLYDITKIVHDIPHLQYEEEALRKLLGETNDRNDAVCKMIQLMLYVIPNNKLPLLAGNMRTWVELTLKSIPSNRQVLPAAITMFGEIARRMFIGTGYYEVVGDWYFSPHPAIVTRCMQLNGPRYNVMYSEEPLPSIINATIPML